MTWIDTDDYTTNDCPYCEDYKKEKEYAADWMQKLSDLLYGNEPFDKETINDCMSELELYFEIEQKSIELKVKGE